jgi:hypothetical protein
LPVFLTGCSPAAAASFAAAARLAAMSSADITLYFGLGPTGAGFASGLPALGGFAPRSTGGGAGFGAGRGGDLIGALKGLDGRAPGGLPVGGLPGAAEAFEGAAGFEDDAAAFDGAGFAEAGLAGAFDEGFAGDLTGEALAAPLASFGTGLLAGALAAGLVLLGTMVLAAWTSAGSSPLRSAGMGRRPATNRSK